MKKMFLALILTFSFLAVSIPAVASWDAAMRYIQSVKFVQHSSQQVGPLTVDTMVDSKGQATFDVLITRDSNGNPQLVILQANGK